MERGANTFPFHNLLPFSESNEGLFLFFLPSLNWIKEQSVETLAIRTFAIKRKTKSQSHFTVLQSQTSSHHICIKHFIKLNHRKTHHLYSSHSYHEIINSYSFHVHYKDHHQTKHHISSQFNIIHQLKPNTKQLKHKHNQLHETRLCYACGTRRFVHN